MPSWNSATSSSASTPASARMWASTTRLPASAASWALEPAYLVASASLEQTRRLTGCISTICSDRYSILILAMAKPPQNSIWASSSATPEFGRISNSKRLPPGVRCYALKPAYRCPNRGCRSSWAPSTQAPPSARRRCSSTKTLISCLILKKPGSTAGSAMERPIRTRCSAASQPNYSTTISAVC